MTRPSSSWSRKCSPSTIDPHGACSLVKGVVVAIVHFPARHRCIPGKGVRWVAAERRDPCARCSPQYSVLPIVHGGKGLAAAPYLDRLGEWWRPIAPVVATKTSTRHGPVT